MQGIKQMIQPNVARETTSRSEELYRRALKVMPGGNTRDSVYRAPFPYYVARASGCRITDVDRVERVDFHNNYTSLIHGHAHPHIIEAVATQMRLGTAMAMPTESEIRLAELLCGRVPSFEQIRFTNSGSEAVMMALKAARAYTGRPKIAKIEGAYHGSYDFAEISQTANPQLWGDENPRSLPVSRGTPQGVLADVIVLPFNHIERSLRILEAHRKDLACVLIDLMPHRLGLIRCTPEYLRGLREWTTKAGALLVFDEVITLRLGYHGAQGDYELQPDLTAMGKIIGGGFPVGAIAGRAEVMAVFDPRYREVPVPHGGTFNANPVTMVAGEAAMSLMTQDMFDYIGKLGERARRELSNAMKSAGVRGRVLGDGSLFYIHLTDNDFTDYRSSYRDELDRRRIDLMLDRLLDRGFILATTTMGCISTVMTETEVDKLAEETATVLHGMKREGVFDASWGVANNDRLIQNG
jgi:glutamate-1-semialdehyde 2,1-aminomutase